MKNWVPAAIAVSTVLFFGAARPACAQNPEKRKEMKALYDKGIALRKTRKFADAVPYMEQAAELAPQVFGPDHEGTAIYLEAAGNANRAVNRLLVAETYYRRALAVYDHNPPKDKLVVARVLNDLGLVLDSSGKPKEAKPILERCLKIREGLMSENDPNLAITANNLGTVCITLGDYAIARHHLTRSLTIEEHLASKNVRGKDTENVANALHNLADLERRTGNYQEAETLATRALKIRESIHGKDHALVAVSLNLLGIILHEKGRLKEAENAHRRALAIREKTFGKDHPGIATSLNNLGLICSDLGRFGEAEELLRRCIAMRERLFGRDHASLASVLNNLAAVLERTGRDQERERLILRGIEIQEKHFGKSHPGLVPYLTNLAMLYSDLSRNKDAEVFLRRALAIQEASSGKDDVHLAKTLANLAVIRIRMGQYRDAEILLLRCLRINESQFGTDHERVAANLSNLANVYWHTRDYAKADEGLARSQKILESHRGRDPKGLAAVLHQRAGLNHLMGRPQLALELQERCLEIHLALSRELFAHSTERDMNAFLETRATYLAQLLNFAAQPNAKSDGTVSALTWTLRLKGAVFDTLCQFRQAQQLLPQDDSLYERVTRYRVQKEFLANAAISPPAGMTPEALKKQLDLAEREVADLEKELNRAFAKKLPRMFDKREKVTLELVRKRLAPKSALIEFVRCRVQDFQSRAWLEPHYYAFVLMPGKDPPRLVDLGEADKIDAGVEALRQEFATFQEKLKDCETAEEAQTLEKAQEKEFKNKTAGLYALLFAPLRKALGQTSLLHLAPDGALNRLPFECLVDGTGKYVIETYSCAYLSSGRDLVHDPVKFAQGTVVFAGPDYKLDAEGRLAHAEKLLTKKNPVVALRNLPSHDVRSVGWKSLPGAAAEAQDIQKILQESAYGPVKTYVGGDALEEVLKAMPAPRVLHLATHGFFLDREPETKEVLEDGAGAGWARKRLKTMENPLLRSGIVLAGANTIGDKDASVRVEDGWVTAEEIALLNLQGTELVVLSACQTGLGDIKTGEGVHGLRRAFLYAGAQTLVTSLFEVPDTETRALMQHFYANFKTGQGKLRALYSAQRRFIDERRQSQGAAHPFFWASFVLVGKTE